MERKKRVGAKKRVAKTPIIVKVSLIIIVLFVFFATTFKIVEIIITHKSDNFPKLEISLSDVPIEQIDANSKDIKYPGNTVKFNTGNESVTYENVEIKGRGNSTWTRTSKKPYQIKFIEKTSLFGFEKARKWVLLANYFDPTFLRTNLAYYLESALKTEYPLNGNYIELYIDDVYRGLYYLSEKIEIGKGRVNLENPHGIIMEIDNLRGGPEECHYSKNGECFLIHDLVDENNESAATNNFLETFDKLESAIKEKDYDTVTSLIDVDSFATYFLLNEFLVNPDAYSSSFYMYKNGEGDKIHAGPGWDFDITIGTKNNTYDFSHSPLETMALKEYANSVPRKTGPTTELSSPAQAISTILYDLMDIPEFEQRVKEIYQETLSGRGEELLDYIKSQAEYIKPAVLRDQKRWKSKTNFDEEVDYLIDWVAKRYDHFEQTYGAKAQETSSGPAPESPQPSQE